YLKLLRQFVEQQAEAPARIALALKTGDTTVAERLAHTVVGVAGSLGGGPVHAAAAALAPGIALGDEARHIEGLQQRLADDLAALISRLRPALSENTSAAGPAMRTDHASLDGLVAEMQKQLGEFDPSAVDLFEGNRELFRALFDGDGFSDFERYVRAYAFGDAQTLFERAAASRGSDPMHP